MTEAINTSVLSDILAKVMKLNITATGEVHLGEMSYGSMEIDDKTFLSIEEIVKQYASGDASMIALDHLARWQYRNSEGAIREALGALAVYLYRCVNIRNEESRSTKPQNKTDNLSDLYFNLSQEKPEYLIHLFRRAVLGNTHLEALLPVKKCKEAYEWLEALDSSTDSETVDRCLQWANTTVTTQPIHTGANVGVEEYAARRLIQIIRSISEYRSNNTASSKLRSFLISVSTLTMVLRATEGAYVDETTLAGDLQGVVNSAERLMVSNAVLAWSYLSDHISNRKMNYGDMVTLGKLQYRVTAGELNLVFGLLAHFLTVSYQTASHPEGARMKAAVMELLRKSDIQTLYLDDQAQHLA